MQTLGLGYDTTITPKWVKTPTRAGGVAQILGPDPQYGLKRVFLDTEIAADTGLPLKWSAWRIRHAGLYEYRKLGDGTVQGFFLVEERFRRRVRLLDRDSAHTMAATMG
jgi:hypothetical protein